ncbi:MAG: sigma-70 family RNA polymerase sigma factor [Pseudomonadota bacterium]
MTHQETTAPPFASQHPGSAPVTKAAGSGVARDPAQLVAAIRAGRPGSEEELARRFCKIARPVLRNLTFEVELQEDVFQDAFVSVLTKVRIGALKEPSRLDPYISRTVKFCFIDAVRKRKRYRNLCTVLEHEELDTPPNPERLLLQCELVRSVRSCVDQLHTPRDRTLLQLLFLEERDKCDVAAELKLSSRHFDRVKFRSLQRLQRQVGEMSLAVE